MTSNIFRHGWDVSVQNRETLSLSWTLETRELISSEAFSSCWRGKRERESFLVGPKARENNPVDLAKGTRGRLYQTMEREQKFNSTVVFSFFNSEELSLKGRDTLPRFQLKSSSEKPGNVRWEIKRKVPENFLKTVSRRSLTSQSLQSHFCRLKGEKTFHLKMDQTIQSIDIVYC
ncbi:hypothetical protein BgiMline_036726 [Biomphalaria glabrata]|nr:hypothetical protein BgiMline_015166 [Biomphalaria glabrata]